MIQIHRDDSLNLAKLEALLQDDPSQQKYRLDRSVFTDEQIFELEMKYIFEGNWVYLAHESQIPNANDYLTMHVGRQPVVITRGKDGQLNALMNTCTHRGATLCRHKKGNKSSFTCPFHGWTFSNTGKLLKVKDGSGADAGYPATFNCEGSHDLVKLGAFENYRGFLFGSINPDVVPLKEYLGEATKIIDMIVDQTPDGLEVLKGASTYYYDGNWKVQAENGADGYHVTAVHWNYAATQQHRKESGKEGIKTMSAGGWAKKGGGSYGFENGHILLWTNWDNPEDRPLWSKREEWVKQFGEERADWMLQKSRNLCLYPNVYFMDQFSSQIRVFRPIAVNRTEVTIYCIAPKGEPAEARASRLRQYEDFFNATGMATPDDLEEFRACQEGYGAAARVRWNEMNRGATHWVTGPDEEANKIGLKPVISGVKTEDEGLYVAQHQFWLKAMRQALEKEAAETASTGA